MLQYARAHCPALSDIERRRSLPFSIILVEEIDTRSLRHRVDGAPFEVRRQRRLPCHLARSDAEHFIAMLLRGDAQELPQRRGIGQGAVARFAFEAVALDQAVEIMARLAGIEAAGEPDGAKRLRQVLVPGAVELASQESVVEARVVGD